jgi:hypothetical protein
MKVRLMGCGHSDEMDNLLWRRDDRRLLGGCWRCRACERTRAQVRRQAIGGSYWKYENSYPRMSQRLWYPKLGAGAHRLTKQGRSAAITEWGTNQVLAIRDKFGSESVDAVLEFIR